MPYYDPTMEALVSEMLKVLDPDVDPDALTYIEQLRAVQAALVALLSGLAVSTPRQAPDPAAEALLRFALGQLNPKAEDQWLELADVGRRLLECVDVELSRWTSSMEQVPGPSGAASLPAVEPVEA